MISPMPFPAVSVTVVRNRKIYTALITNEIARLVPSWEKIKQFMHQSIPAVPIPPPGNRGAFAYVVSPGGWALA